MSKLTPAQTSRRHLLKTSTLALAASGVALSSGCFGGFALTKRVYMFNASVQNKWLRWLVFLLLYIFPVYAIAALVDALVFNTIEFWSGKPALSTGKKVQDGDKKAVVKSESPDRVVIELHNGKTKVRKLALTRLDNAVLLESGDGRRFYVRDEAGAQESTEIVDPQGTAVAHLSPAQWRRAQERVAAGESHGLAMNHVLFEQSPRQATV